MIREPKKLIFFFFSFWYPPFSLSIKVGVVNVYKNLCVFMHVVLSLEISEVCIYLFSFVIIFIKKKEKMKSLDHLLLACEHVNTLCNLNKLKKNRGARVGVRKKK